MNTNSKSRKSTFFANPNPSIQQDTIEEESDNSRSGTISSAPSSEQYNFLQKVQFKDIYFSNVAALTSGTYLDPSHVLSANRKPKKMKEKRTSFFKRSVGLDLFNLESGISSSARKLKKATHDDSGGSSPSSHNVKRQLKKTQDLKKNQEPPIFKDSQKILLKARDYEKDDRVPQFYDDLLAIAKRYNSKLPFVHGIGSVSLCHLSTIPLKSANVVAALNYFKVLRELYRDTLEPSDYIVAFNISSEGITKKDPEVKNVSREVFSNYLKDFLSLPSNKKTFVDAIVSLLVRAIAGTLEKNDSWSLDTRSILQGYFLKIKAEFDDYEDQRKAKIHEALIKRISLSSPLGSLWALHFLSTEPWWYDSHHSLDKYDISLLNELFIRTYSFLGNSKAAEIWYESSYNSMDSRFKGQLSSLVITLCFKNVAPEQLRFVDDTVLFNLVSLILKLCIYGSYEVGLTFADPSNLDLDENLLVLRYAAHPTDDKTVFAILKYLKEVYHLPGADKIFADVIEYVLKFEEITNTIFVIKRIFLDLDFVSLSKNGRLISNWLVRLSNYHISGNSITGQLLKHLLTSLSGFESSIIYQPLIDSLNTDKPAEVAKMLNVVFFLNSLLGEVYLWLGIGSGMGLLWTEFKSSNVYDHSGFPSRSHSFIRGSTEYSPVNIDFVSIIFLGDIINDISDTRSGVTLGRFALSLEIIWAFRRIRLAVRNNFFKPEIKEVITQAFIKIEKYFNSVLRKYSDRVLIIEKMLIVNFLLEFRLFYENFTKSYWMTCVTKWIREYVTEYKTLKETELDNIYKNLQEVYLEGAKFVSPPLPENKDVQLLKPYFNTRLSFLFNLKNSKGVLKQISCGPRSNIVVKNVFKSYLTCLTFISPGLEKADVEELFPKFWNILNILNVAEINNLCFLIYYFSEKHPEFVKEYLKLGLYHDNPLERLENLKKIALLFQSRNFFNAIAVPSDTPTNSYVASYFAADPKFFRSLFKPFTYVPQFLYPDLGTDDMISVKEQNWLLKLKEAANAVRNEDSKIRLEVYHNSEGNNESNNWDANGENDDDRKERVRFRLLYISPDNLMDDFDLSFRRVNKLRAIFPSALNIISYILIDLLSDECSEASIFVRDLISSILREDSGLFVRMFLVDLNSVDFYRKREALLRLSRLSLIKQHLPSSFNYLLLNHIAGELKNSTTLEEGHSFEYMSLALPISSSLVTGVQGIGVRDLKKSRFDHYFINDGHFWFIDGLQEKQLPKGPFTSEDFDIQPNRNLSRRKSYFGLNEEDRSSELMMQVTMIRISQIQFMLNLLLKHPVEKNSLMSSIIQMLEKNEKKGEAALKGFLDMTLDLRKEKIRIYDFSRFQRSDKEEKIKDLIVLFQKSWLSFLDTLFSRIGGSPGELDEVNLLTKSVQAWLLRYYFDYLFVEQGLSFILRISARFRRSIGPKSYGLFLPTIFELYFIYYEKSWHKGIQMIQNILKKYHEIHGDGFILISLVSLIKLLNTAGCLNRNYVDKRRIRFAIVEIFMNIRSKDQPEKKGIYVKSGGFDDISKNILLEDFLKHIFFSIAYDLSSKRSEEVIRLLVFLLPALSNINELADVLNEGMFALVKVFENFNSKSTIQRKKTDDLGENDTELKTSVSDFVEVNNDGVTIRIGYFLAITCWLGKLDRNKLALDKSFFERTASVLKDLSRDAIKRSIYVDFTFVIDFAEATLFALKSSEKFDENSLILLKVLSNLFKSYQKIEQANLIPLMRLCVSICKRVSTESQACSYITDKIVSPFLNTPLSSDKSKARLISIMGELLVVQALYHQDVVPLLEKSRPDPSVLSLIILIIPFCRTLGDFEVKDVSHLKHEKSTKTIIFAQMMEYLLRSRRTALIDSISDLSQPLEVGLRKHYLEALLLAVKTCIYYEDFNEFPGIWIILQQFIEMEFNEERKTAPNLEIMWSFLEFVYYINCPLAVSMRKFVVEQGTWMSENRNSFKLKTTGSSQVIRESTYKNTSTKKALTHMLQTKLDLTSFMNRGKGKTITTIDDMTIVNNEENESKLGALSVQPSISAISKQGSGLLGDNLKKVVEGSLRVKSKSDFFSKDKKSNITLNTTTSDELILTEAILQKGICLTGAESR